MTVLVALAALLGNSYCYARCLSAMPNPPSTAAPDGCHDSSDSKQSNHQHCGEQHYFEIAISNSQALLANLAMSAASVQIPAVPNANPAAGVRWFIVAGLRSRNSSPPSPLIATRPVLRV